MDNERSGKIANIGTVGAQGGSRTRTKGVGGSSARWKKLGL